MSVMEKAKELGQIIRGTQEYLELEKANENVKEDENATQIIEQINQLQEQINFAQQSGVEPSSEQIENFNELKEKMQNNLTIQSFIKAQEQFNQVMQDINNAISEGLTGENNSE